MLNKIRTIWFRINNKASYKSKYFFYIGVSCLVLLLLDFYLFFFTPFNYASYDYFVLNVIPQTLLISLTTFILLKSGEILSKKNLVIFCSGSFSITIIPALFIIGFSIFSIKKITLLDGLSFFILLNASLAVPGFALSYLAYFIGKKFYKTLFIFILAIFLFLPVLTIYYFPQIYLYHPIVTFYPGVIYDELLQVDISIILYKVYTSVLFSGLVLFIHFLGKRTKKKVVFLLMASVLVSVLYVAFSIKFGFVTTQAKLINELPVSKWTNHFQIHAPSEITEQEIKYIQFLCEYHYSNLSSFLDTKVSTKINIYLFRDNRQKKIIYGAENADMARTWSNEIFLTLGSAGSNLKHELAHLFAAQFGVTPFKLAANFNPALIEGVAVASDPKFDEYDIDYLAFNAENSKFKVNISELFTSFNFFSISSNLAYIYSGGFCKFLIEKYGINKFKKLYSTNNYNIVYGNDINRISLIYSEFLNSKYSIQDSSIAVTYFAQKPYIKKLFPRFIAKLNDEINNQIIQNRLSPAKENIDILMRISNDYKIFSKLILYYELTNKVELAIINCEKYVKEIQNSIVEARVNIKIGDLYCLIGKKEKAIEVYEAAINKKPSSIIKDAVNIRLLLLGSPLKIENYLNGSTSIKYSMLAELLTTNSANLLLPGLINLAGQIKNKNSELLSLLNRLLLTTEDLNPEVQLDLLDFYCKYASVELFRQEFEKVILANNRNSNNIIKSEHFSNKLHFFKYYLDKTN